uniref:Ycf55 n=1 Tax=Schimmelmannia schousboei TaxID=173468 RepID=A0A1C9C8U6_9FLOR|nr:hypothetical protein Schim_119 [Schimmelmannia schousboei]AOM64800.1 hypothetical protein Schim_119 [Schimmelmannia schousboei]
MMKYWPYKSGITLNNEVAYLFFATRQKFLSNLSNTTNSSLYIDILDNSNKSKLFQIILTELEILILDIVELDLNSQNLRSLNHKILYDLIQKVSKIFFIKLNNSYNLISVLDHHEGNLYYFKIVSLEHKLLLGNLLIYLIFGSAHINESQFAFNNQNTPKEHVALLLENLIIQVSNLVIYVILENIKSLPQIAYFLRDNQLCNSIYVSTRSIAFFRNSLMFQSFFNLYIYQPKAIYSSRYKVWLIGSNGLVTRYIYTLRLDDFTRLSRLKLMFLFCLEIQDIIIPNLEKFILVLGKVLLYIFINIVGNSAILFVRAIVKQLYRQYK